MPSSPFDHLSQWWAVQRDPAQSPTLWVLLSVVIGIAAAQAIWWAETSPRPTARRMSHWLASPAGRWIAWWLRMAWLVGPGYAALLSGVASPRRMGLSQIDWGASFGYGLAFAGLALAVLLAAGISLRRSGPATSPWPSWSAAVAGSLLLAVEAGALQFQWAFYRDAAIQAAEAWGMAAPAQAGTWVGVLLVTLQGGLDPALRQDLRSPVQVLRWALLLATAVLYLLSRNFWLGWALHAAAAVLLEPRLLAAANEKGSRPVT